MVLKNEQNKARNAMILEVKTSFAEFYFIKEIEKIILLSLCTDKFYD